MKNILYFEGAGMDYETNENSDVENYRIRTAFVNNEGTPFYIELSNVYRRNDKNKTISEWGLHVDQLFEIVDGEEKNDEITRCWKKIVQSSYTKGDITNWINANLNCSFETIQVLNMFYGYRVHGEKEQYNLINNHIVDHGQAEKRKLAYNKVDIEYRTLLNEKHTKISLLEMDESSITIRCYACVKALGDIPRIKRIEIV
ncbi:hypothetical protein ACVWZB_004805 [Paenibacillus polymyxa]